MRRSSSKSDRVFTLDEANAMLPLVSAITADLAYLQRDIDDREQRLSNLTQGRDLETGDPYDDELAQIHEELDKDKIRLTEFRKELQDLGVEPKNHREGLVDFPSELDGQKVCLRWKLGEAEVMFGHDVDARFDGRQPCELEAVDSSGSDAADDSVF